MDQLVVGAEEVAGLNVVPVEIGVDFPPVEQEDPAVGLGGFPVVSLLIPAVLPGDHGEVRWLGQDTLGLPAYVRAVVAVHGEPPAVVEEVELVVVAGLVGDPFQQRDGRADQVAFPVAGVEGDLDLLEQVRRVGVSQWEADACIPSPTGTAT
jgi:hypothetical protein